MQSQSVEIQFTQFDTRPDHRKRRAAVEGIAVRHRPLASSAHFCDQLEIRGQDGARTVRHEKLVSGPHNAQRTDVVLVLDDAMRRDPRYFLSRPFSRPHRLTFHLFFNSIVETRDTQQHSRNGYFNRSTTQTLHSF